MSLILFAEDHSVVRMGMKLIMEELLPDVCFAESETFNDVILRLDRKEKYDLLLLDINLPGGGNMHMIEAVKMRQREMPVLIFSAFDESLYAINYIKAGAQGFLSKNSKPEEIKVAIQKAMRREIYVSPFLQEQLLEERMHPQRSLGLPETLKLSAREAEVMQLLVKGASATEIRQTLHIQHSTISTHKNRIFEKLKVKNIIELAEKVKTLKPGSETGITM